MNVGEWDHAVKPENASRRTSWLHSQILVMPPSQTRLQRRARRPTSKAHRMKPIPCGQWIASAWLALFTASAGAQPAVPVTASPEAKDKGPVVLVADVLDGQPDGQTRASGHVRLRQEEWRLDTSELRFDRASGVVKVPQALRFSRQDDLVSGSSGEFNVQNDSGTIVQPRYFFSAASAGGESGRVDVLSNTRVELLDARLTSCLADDAGQPLRAPGTPRAAAVPSGRARAAAKAAAASTVPPADTQALAQALEKAADVAEPPKRSSTPGWELQSPRILLDFDKGEGLAENARLSFLGLPVLVLPRLSFPLGNERRSGWLAPIMRIDSRSGIDIGVPYYWNIAPYRDATITPSLATRRGPAAELELRQLLQDQSGQMNLHLVPQDQQTGRSRSAGYWQYAMDQAQWQLRTVGLRVSDDAYWKDFPHTATFRTQNSALSDVDESSLADRAQPTLQPRLLGQSVQATRAVQWGSFVGSAYARAQQWQVLQGTDPNAAFIAPYQRSPQMGVAGAATLGWGLELNLETELNHFTRPAVAFDPAPTLRPGWRWHALGSLSRPWISPMGWLIPKLSLNSASYRLDAPMGSMGPVGNGMQDFSRSIGTASVDGGLIFERSTRLFQRDLVQTLEPRVVYVNTPMRDQRLLPNFDSAAKDFNSVSIFSENAFSGVDRVSDAHQMTTGLNTRFLDAASGEELLRASFAQRLTFRDQLTTPDGTVANQRLSDMLFAASTAMVPRWIFSSVFQYSPDVQRVTRSVVNVVHVLARDRYLSASYRFTKDSAETVDLRAQWPIWSRYSEPSASAPSGACTLMVNSISRVNYNTRERKLTDSTLGLEMDAGCWVMRLGVQRQSTGLTEAVTRLILQLELMGISRAPTNPFRL